MLSNIEGTREKAYLIVKIVSGPCRGEIGILEEAKTIHNITYLYIRVAEYRVLMCKPEDANSIDMVTVPDSKYYEKLQEQANKLGIRI